jgi:hypothetical protein
VEGRVRLLDDRTDLEAEIGPTDVLDECRRVEDDRG